MRFSFAALRLGVRLETRNPKLETRNSMNWTELETSTHQDHIIKHVLGATVLGWIVGGEAAHFLLDIGFLWTIYSDGEMNFLPQGVAISELQADDISNLDKTELAFDADLLLAEGREATGLKRFSAAATDCLVTNVELFGSDAERKIVVTGEAATIVIQTSPETSSLTIDEQLNA